MSASYDVIAARVPLTDEDYARIRALVPQTGFVSDNSPWFKRTLEEEQEIQSRWNARKLSRSTSLCSTKPRSRL